MTEGHFQAGMSDKAVRTFQVVARDNINKVEKNALHERCETHLKLVHSTIMGS